MNNLLKFPKGFFWGAATSAHQVEGNNHNDWTEWEKANAERLAKESQSRYAHWMKNWSDIKLKAQNPKNYISGKAADHYNRFREDFDIAKSLGHNAHRFSIEWSRIEPEEGKFDEKEIEHYREVIKALRERGLEPFVTLWHWTMPVWFTNNGGFEKRENIKYFVRFCDRVVSELKSEVKFWIVLNEPNIYSGMSYIRGEWPPQKKSYLMFLRVFSNLIEAYNHVYDAIHNINPEVSVGIAQSVNYFEGWIAPVVRWFWVNRFLNRINNHLDFIGVNYYYRRLIRGFNFDAGEGQRTDMGWEIHPEGIYNALKGLSGYHKPIYITENGIADARDAKREKFIGEHLRWLARALGEGVDIRGYFHWSLLDNFEWDKGFWPRFGLVEIDYKTLERKIRPSGYVYAKIAKNNAIENDDLNKSNVL